MASLRRFDIGSISRKLNGINARISVANSILFPCLNLLSFYQFKKRFVKVLSNGDVQGGFSRMIITLAKQISAHHDCRPKIVKISVLFMKYRDTKDPAIAEKLQPFAVTKAIRNIIQIE